MKLFYLNNDGAGYADHVEAQDGITVAAFFAEKLPGRGANVTGRLIKVDSSEVFVAIGKDEVPVPLGLVVQAVRVWQAKAQTP